MLHVIESDTPFDVVFIHSSEPGNISYRDVYRKILTCLDCMIEFGLGTSSILKEITLDQVSQWTFGNFFVTFGLPKTIVVDAYEFSSGVFKKTFSETLLIPVHATAMGNHKANIYGGVHHYLNNIQKINSVENVRTHQ